MIVPRLLFRSQYRWLTYDSFNTGLLLAAVLRLEH